MPFEVHIHTGTYSVFPFCSHNPYSHNLAERTSGKGSSEVCRSQYLSALWVWKGCH